MTGWASKFLPFCFVGVVCDEEKKNIWLLFLFFFWKSFPKNENVIRFFEQWMPIANVFPVPSRLPAPRQEALAWIWPPPSQYPVHPDRNVQLHPVPGDYQLIAPRPKADVAAETIRQVGVWDGDVVVEKNRLRRLYCTKFFARRKGRRQACKLEFDRPFDIWKARVFGNPCLAGSGRTRVSERTVEAEKPSTRAIQRFLPKHFWSPQEISMLEGVSTQTFFRHPAFVRNLANRMESPARHLIGTIDFWFYYYCAGITSGNPFRVQGVTPPRVHKH